MIALWEGMPLEESHRHHSHLAGITPFDIFDLDDPAWREILERSIGEWIYPRPGHVDGLVRALGGHAIHTRFGNGEAAETCCWRVAEGLHQRRARNAARRATSRASLC